VSEKPFQQLVQIMEKLRSSGGCPWDQQQTHESLKPYLLEEAYEVLDALDKNVDEGLKEELGDLMLQIVFHAQIAAEEKRFTITEVLNTINDKLVRRHPHVFGQTEIKTAEEQRIHWEKLKKKEGKKSVLDGVPKISPALLKAYRIQQKASTVGFDWGEIEPVWEKVNEEIEELKEVIGTKEKEKITEEFGDLLFALVNLSRFIKVNPEDALRQAVEKFMNRFQKIEKTMATQGKDLRDATLEELDAVWNRIKQE
jgi:tetrapyrrole methylase family protein/MazG family protein